MLDWVIFPEHSTQRTGEESWIICYGVAKTGEGWHWKPWMALEAMARLPAVWPPDSAGGRRLPHALFWSSSTLAWADWLLQNSLETEGRGNGKNTGTGKGIIKRRWHAHWFWSKPVFLWCWDHEYSSLLSHIPFGSLSLWIDEITTLLFHWLFFYFILSTQTSLDGTMSPCSISCHFFSLRSPLTPSNPHCLPGLCWPAPLLHRSFWTQNDYPVIMQIEKLQYTEKRALSSHQIPIVVPKADIALLSEGNCCPQRHQGTYMFTLYLRPSSCGALWESIQNDFLKYVPLPLLPSACMTKSGLSAWVRPLQFLSTRQHFCFLPPTIFLSVIRLNTLSLNHLPPLSSLCFQKSETSFNVKCLVLFLVSPPRVTSTRWEQSF